MRDWTAWHNDYDDPASPLSRRLVVVQNMIRSALDECAPGPVRVVSMCAGRGDDLIGALDGHPRAVDIRARLVELDPTNAEIARARPAELSGIEVVTGDASLSDVYDGAVPADLVIACGVFGNISDDDVRRTIDFLPAMCRPRATVIWTRHRNPPDLTTDIARWFGGAGFDEIAYVAPADTRFGVGAHRFMGSPVPLVAGRRLFTFFR